MTNFKYNYNQKKRIIPTIKLKSIICILNDEIDKDEVYLKLDGKKIWPEGAAYKAIDNGEKTSVEIQFEYPEGEMKIELWDFDYMSRNDLLGTFTMKIDENKGNYNTSMKLKDMHSTASYILDWAVV